MYASIPGLEIQKQKRVQHHKKNAYDWIKEQNGREHEKPENARDTRLKAILSEQAVEKLNSVSTEGMH